ncbi:MAG: V-type ATP synthase subunit D [Candidatus Heimdallarchaeota archaeon]|nr:MAG: V-type ATP synthase subunit D [Candidatus Heimdallarchaeota archaeon]
MSTEDIIPGTTPTRMELLELKQRLELANKGYELLSEKLEALTGELFSTVTTYKEKRKKVQKTIGTSQEQLVQLELQMGKFLTQKVALGYPRKFRIDSKSRKLLGISIPVFQIIKEESPQTDTIPYSMRETTARFDSALKVFEDTLQAIIYLAETQSTLTRLAREIIETKRRVNALNYIIIPRIEATVDWIQLTLAERERESFVRLKKVKKKISRK